MQRYACISVTSEERAHHHHYHSSYNVAAIDAASAQESVERSLFRLYFLGGKIQLQMDMGVVECGGGDS
jgi:hypothetical protein